MSVTPVAGLPVLAAIALAALLMLTPVATLTHRELRRRVER